MKKKKVSSQSLERDEMLPEYDFSGGVRGKHYKAYRNGHTVTVNKADGSEQIQYFTLEEGAVMLETDVREIPDLHFDIQLLVSDPPQIASRLRFDCTPRGTFLGLSVNGRRVTFAENVFYRFREDKIEQVWSVIDRMAIEAQL